jgi:phenylalanyl-tRNA synthetase beta chain
MHISHRWLTEFVALDPAVWTPSVIAETLTQRGIEVDAVHDERTRLSGFVTGRVTEKIKHPKADKLSVCTVDVGDATPRTIVCGAPNVAADQIVAVALEGAVVPRGGFVIERRALRGVESQGMICSQAELELGDDADGIWVLPASTPVGVPLAEALGHNDTIYEISVTPNRADCLSHIGVAREIKNLIPKTENQRAQKTEKTEKNDVGLTVEVQDAQKCPHYVAQVIRNVQAVESPAWLQERLTAIGVRPRNVLVDVTNYVNMGWGQPLHAFDLASLRGTGIVVRTAHDGESFTTLDDKERELASGMLLICDKERPVAIAGVMGGINSEIRGRRTENGEQRTQDDAGTTDVVIESAYFEPTSIRRTAKVLGLSTDASYRFERGVDVGGIERALDIATAMICELTGGVAAERVTVGGPPATQRTVSVRTQRVRDMIGADVSDAQQIEILRSLGFDVADITNTSYVVTVPTWRVDIEQEIDIVEEVARCYGLDNIPMATHARVAITADPLPGALRARPWGRTATTFLVARGFNECRTQVQTAPEFSDGPVVKNPLGRDLSVLRTSVVPSLLKVASLNLRHGADGVRLCELGTTFTRDNASALRVREEDRVAILVTGTAPQHWSSTTRQHDASDVLGHVEDLLHHMGVRDATLSAPTSTMTSMYSENRLEIRRGDRVIGVVGQISPAFAKTMGVDVDAWAAEIDVDALAPQPRHYHAVGQFPAVRRDLAFVVSEGVSAGALISVAESAANDTLRSVTVFDVYRDASIGADRKSVGLAMTFMSDARTLVDDEVDRVVGTIIGAAEKALGASVRQ